MTEEQNSQGLNPAWNDLLKDIPEEYHAFAIPKLQEWDKRMQDKLQETNNKYEPYKPFVENQVSPDYIDQAIYLAQQMQENPQEVLDRAIEAFNLPYTKGAASATPEATNVDDQQEWDGVDITQNPEFKAMKQALESVQGEWTQRKQIEEQQEQLKQTEAYIESLHKGPDGKTVEFDDMYVAALISAGVPGDKAVAQYQETINSAAAKYAQQQLQQNPGQQTPSFTVMGGDSGGGSGIPVNAPDFGKMKRNELDDVVLQMLRNSNNQQ